MRRFPHIGVLGLVCCGLVALGIATPAAAQDCTAWSLQATTGPSPRSVHAMAYDSARGVTVLFGGWDEVGVNGETWQ